MTLDFQELIAEAKQVKADEVRSESSTFFEAVVSKERLAQLKGCLESFFGQACALGQEELPAEIQEPVKKYGGIMPGQTLYYRDGEYGIFIAMLWPWRDAVHTTIKIIKYQQP